MPKPQVDNKRIDLKPEARASAFMKGVEQLCSRFPEFRAKLEALLRELENEEHEAHASARQKR